MSGLVVIGGSAGSHPALLRMVAALPTDLPAAVLVVVHVGAQAGSHLPQILCREGRLPAAHATDGAPLRNGEIVVAPPGLHLIVDGSRVRLSAGPRVNRFRPAVDVLFETAAWSAGPLVTAVVLSGMLDDGAVGAARVAGAGGQVLVEVPDEAPYRSMPRAALAAAPGATAVPAAALAAAVDGAVRQAVAEPALEGAQWSTRGGAVVRMADSGDLGFLDGGETRLTRLGCPECGGGMAEISLPSISYFRCHIGHQFRPQTLAAAQAEAVEAKLWSAVTTLDEQAVVLHHLAGHAPARPAGGQRGDDGETADHARRAQQITELADTIRAHLQRNDNPGEQDVPRRPTGRRELRSVPHPARSSLVLSCPVVCRRLPGLGAAGPAVPQAWATIRAARSRTGTLDRWEARRSMSNASASPQRDWTMMMPLACSITGMVSSRASSRACSDRCSSSRPAGDDCRSPRASMDIRRVA